MRAGIGVLLLAVAATVWGFSTLTPLWYLASAGLLVTGVAALRMSQRSTVDRYGAR